MSPAPNKFCGANEVKRKTSKSRRRRVCTTVRRRDKTSRHALLLSRHHFFERFLIDLKGTNVRQRPLYRTHDLTFERAVQEVPLIETSTEAAVKLQNKTVHALTKGKGRRKNQQKTDKLKKTPERKQACYRRGSSARGPRNCPFNKATCYGCRRRGHITDRSPGKV